MARELGRWLEMAAAVRATYASGPDFALRTAVRMVGDAPLDLSSLRHVTSGGEAVRISTIEAFERRFDLPGIVRPAYGLAESTLAVTMARRGERLVVDGAGNVGCGPPLPGVELAIVGEDGEPAPPGSAGEIRVRSAALFSGYFESPPGDTTLTPDGWLATGDWGRIGENGNLFVIGRRRVLLKHGGATYAPRELEEAADAVPGVRGSAAISLGRDGRAGSQSVVMVVELASPEETAPGSIAEAVARAVRRDVGVLPAEVLVVEGGVLPRTETGKLRHAELRRRVAAGLDAAAVRHGERTGWVE
jgi:acyl-CoA synthetase (AMP-forming)/AMP-acid ligase II